MTSIYALGILFAGNIIMAAPVQNQPERQILPPNPALDEQQVRPPLGGVGDVPDAIHPASNQNLPALEKGYVETFVQSLIDWVKFIFKKICFCFFQEEGPAAPVHHVAQAPVPPQPPAPPQHLEPRPEVVAQIRREVQLLTELDRLTQMERNRIYLRIGEKAFSYFYPRQWFRSYEATGKYEVEKNPLLLEQYIQINRD